MVFCPNCGTKGTGKFCAECGTKLPDVSELKRNSPCSAGTSPAKPSTSSGAAKTASSPRAAPTSQQSSSLLGVTSAVRDYTAAASTEEKEKKYGQQKWGLFETDYQRRKGITTEQSLQEIEDFCQHGIAPKPSNKPVNNNYSTDYKPSGFQTAQSERLMSGSKAAPSASQQQGLDAKKFGGASGSVNLRNEFNTTGNRGGNVGEQMLADFLARDSAKYKPGYKGELNYNK